MSGWLMQTGYGGSQRSLTSCSRDTTWLPTGCRARLVAPRSSWGLTYYVFFERDFEFMRPVAAALAGV